MYPLLLLENRLLASWDPASWQDVTVLLAVSGGADSVALACAMVRLKTTGAGRLVIAHMNHGLRGGESDADEAFVRKLAEDLGLACDVGVSDRLTESAPDGLEAAARDARYQFLQQTAQRLGARYVVTAHTADDQAETILHRTVRGTGLAGLSGMRRARPLGDAVTLIRPLLGFRRTQIMAYLDERERSFRTDSSNVDPRFTRNRIRHTLLPLLESQFNPAVVEAVLRLGSLAGEAQSVIDALARECLDRACDFGSLDRVILKTPTVLQESRYVVREMLIELWRKLGWPRQAMGYREWELLADMVLDESGEPTKRVLPGGVVVERRGSELFLGGSHLPDATKSSGA